MPTRQGKLRGLDKGPDAHLVSGQGKVERVLLRGEPLRELVSLWALVGLRWARLEHSSVGAAGAIHRKVRAVYVTIDLCSYSILQGNIRFPDKC